MPGTLGDIAGTSESKIDISIALIQSLLSNRHGIRTIGKSKN